MILLVEDDPGLRVAVDAFLTAEGLEVETASDGAGALIALEAGGVDLLVVDLGLRSLPTGADVARYAVRHGVRTLIWTGRPELAPEGIPAVLKGGPGPLLDAIRGAT